MSESNNRRIHPLAILGALLFAAVLLGLTYIIFNKSAQSALKPEEDAVYDITITPTSNRFRAHRTPPRLQPRPTSCLRYDRYRQFCKVIGTKGLGLNIRNSAGRATDYPLPWTRKCLKSSDLVIDTTSFGGTESAL